MLKLGKVYLAGAELEPRPGTWEAAKLWPYRISVTHLVVLYFLQSPLLRVYEADACCHQRQPDTAQGVWSLSQGFLGCGSEGVEQEGWRSLRQTNQTPSWPSAHMLETEAQSQLEAVPPDSYFCCFSTHLPQTTTTTSMNTRSLFGIALASTQVCSPSSTWGSAGPGVGMHLSPAMPRGAPGRVRGPRCGPTPPALRTQGPARGPSSSLPTPEKRGGAKLTGTGSDPELCSMACDFGREKASGEFH